VVLPDRLSAGDTRQDDLGAATVAGKVVGVTSADADLQAGFGHQAVGPTGSTPAGGAHQNQVILVIGIVDADPDPLQHFLTQLVSDLVFRRTPVSATSDNDLNVLIRDAQVIQLVDQRQGN